MVVELWDCLEMDKAATVEDAGPLKLTDGIDVWWSDGWRERNGELARGGQGFRESGLLVRLRTAAVGRHKVSFTASWPLNLNAHPRNHTLKPIKLKEAG